MKSKFFIYILIIIISYSCSRPQPRKPINHSTTSFYKELIAQNKKLNRREKSYLEYLMTKESINKYIPSETGFWFFFNEKNIKETPKPKAEDVVTISYNVMDILNNEIYPKQEKTFKIDKEEFIPALQDGVKLMQEGESATFVIPSYRGFGVVGDGYKIGVNQPIKSTMKLISIKFKNNESK